MKNVNELLNAIAQVCEVKTSASVRFEGGIIYTLLLVSGLVVTVKVEELENGKGSLTVKYSRKASQPTTERMSVEISVIKDMVEITMENVKKSDFIKQMEALGANIVYCNPDEKE
jgi:hypothetical protein